MTYAPQAFPVQVQIGRRYDPGTAGRGRVCRATWTPWWSNDTYDQNRGGTPHAAVDIMAPIGALVVAPVSGRVVTSWIYRGERRPGVALSPLGGWNVRIAGDDGYSHYFAHLHTKPLVRPGQRVGAGDVIGLVGQTGNARFTCPHLHYQVRKGVPGDNPTRGSTVNPVPVLAAMMRKGAHIRLGPVGVAAGAGMIFGALRLARRMR